MGFEINIFKLNQDHRLLLFFFRNVTSINHYIINKLIIN